MRFRKITPLFRGVFRVEIYYHCRRRRRRRRCLLLYRERVLQSLLLAARSRTRDVT